MLKLMEVRKKNTMSLKICLIEQKKLNTIMVIVFWAFDVHNERH